MSSNPWMDSDPGARGTNPNPRPNPNPKAWVPNPNVRSGLEYLA